VLAAIAACYTVFGLWILNPDAVYSGDIGVKYVQARALVAHNFASMDIPYPGAFLDPAREFIPMRPPFVMATAGTTQAIFSPLSAVAQGIAVGVAGMRGLVLLSLAGAIVTLWSAARLAPHGFATPVLIAIGIGSPLWFYAVSGWEHAPAVALGTAAFALAVRARSVAAAAACGILLGAGAVLRDEVVLLLPGVLVAIQSPPRTLRPVAAVAVLVPLLLAAAVEVQWFQRPAAAHLRHAVHLVQRATHVTAEANPDVPVLKPFTLRDRYETVVQYWLLGYGNDRLIAIFGGSLVAALLLRQAAGSSAPLLVWLVGIVCLAAIDLREVVTAPKWLAGLHRCSPYLVFALLPLPAGFTGETRLRRTILFAAVAYLIIAFAGVDTSGGKSLGPRLLLPLLPLLAVSAVVCIAAYVRAPRRLDRWVGTVGVGLAGMAVTIHALGCIPAWYARNRDDYGAVRSVIDSGQRLIVADDQFTAQLLLPLYYRRILLLADTPESSRRLGAQLANNRLASVLVVSRSSETPIDLAPFRKRKTEQHGRMTLQYWER
jgi:hypothetical protein